MTDAPRFASLVLAGALALTGLTACKTTTYTCSNTECSFSIQGEGADVELNDEITVTLLGASEGVARFKVDDSETECRAGETVTVGGAEVTCNDVGDDKLEGKLSY